VRSFEIVYCRGKTDLLLGAKTLDDMGSYADLFTQVYGELEFEKAGQQPPYLEELQEIVIH